MNLRDLLGPVLILASLLFIYWFMWRSSGFSRSNFRVGLRGEGASLVLAILTLAHFIFDSSLRVGPNPGLLAVLSLLGAVLLMALVSRSGTVPWVLGVAAIFVFLWDVLREDGAATGAYFIVLTVGLLLVAGLVRGRRQD